MIISKVNWLTKKKVQVFLDGEPAFIVNSHEWKKMGYFEGEELSASEADALQADLAHRAVKEAMTLLQARDYPRQALYNKLVQKGYQECYVQAAMDYLDQYHYLDDKRYIQYYLETRKGTMSRQMVKAKLCQKGLSKEFIEEELEKSDWNDQDGIMKEMSRKGDPESMSEKDKLKIYQSLLRKGYSYGDIRCVSEIIHENTQNVTFENV